MLIIVADDDASQRLYTAALLRRAGHECIVCSGGAEVIAALERTDAALVVSDVHMPDVDGLAVCRTIRSTDYGRYVYILLITATGDRSDYVRCLEAGADDFMTKPVESAVLAIRVTAARRILAYDQTLQAQARTLAAARAQLDSDLASAGMAQRALLPVAGKHRLQGCEIAQLFIPADSLSGDMFNYFAVEGARIGFYAADVAGHGVRAALVAATLGHIISPSYFTERRSARRGAHIEVSAHLDPGRLPARLNQRFIQPDYGDTYFTLLSGLIDCSADLLSFCQAGHPHPLILRADGSTEWIGDGGLPVGLFADATWTTESVRFESGTRLIVHSDGITEASAPGGELFGEDRLLDFCRERRAKSASDMCDELAEELRRWMGDRPNDDDVTMIVIDR